jgi:RHS repeat-associated protein
VHDLNGNRVTAGSNTYQTGANNQLLSDGTYNYSYDLEGNRTGRTRISDGQFTEYRYDQRNQLTFVGTKTSQGSGTYLNTVEYAYDLFGRRVKKIVDADGSAGGAAVTTNFIYDGESIVLTVSGTSAATMALGQRYLHGPNIDQVLAQENASTNAVQWMAPDHLGTVRDMTDGAGTAIVHVTFGAFGQLVNLDNPQGVPYLFGFTGREWDAETGLWYYRARYYDANTGRFDSEDPLGFAAGDTNLSRYVGNGPTNATDPSGMEEVRGHHYFPQKYLKLFYSEGLITEDAFYLGMGYVTGDLKTHVNNKAHDIYSTRVAILFQKYANKKNCPIDVEEMKVFIDKVADGKHPVTGKIDDVLRHYFKTEIKSNLRKAADNDVLEEILKRGQQFPRARQFMKHIAEKTGKLIPKRRIAKIIPLVGTVATLYFWGEDVEARGPIAGSCNSALDAVPLVGTIKGIGEWITGSNLVETYDDEEIREAKWELFDAMLEEERRNRKPPQPAWHPFRPYPL